MQSSKEFIDKHIISIDRLLKDSSTISNVKLCFGTFQEPQPAIMTTFTSAQKGFKVAKARDLMQFSFPPDSAPLWYKYAQSSRPLFQHGRLVCVEYIHHTAQLLNRRQCRIITLISLRLIVDN